MVQIAPEDVLTKGMDMGDVLKAESMEKMVTITNAGQQSRLTLLHYTPDQLQHQQHTVRAAHRQAHQGVQSSTQYAAYVPQLSATPPISKLQALLPQATGLLFQLPAILPIQPLLPGRRPSAAPLKRGSWSQVPRKR